MSDTTERVAVLAEDDVALRSMIRQVCVESGYRVEAYGSGDQLLQALLTRFDYVGTPPDLVVTDVRMPGATGLEVVSRLRKFDPVTRVVVVTAFPDLETEHAARRLNAVLLAKPFQLEELRRVLD